MALPAAVFSSIALTASQPSAAKPIGTEQSLQNTDRGLRNLIAKATGSPEYWSFAAVRNDYSHCYFRYPAMMVAEMQRHLISIVLQLQPNVRTLGDPFAGSGTVLLEAMFSRPRRPRLRCKSTCDSAMQIESGAVSGKRTE